MDFDLDLSWQRDIARRLSWGELEKNSNHLAAALRQSSSDSSNSDLKCFINTFDGTKDVVDYIRTSRVNTRIFDPYELSSDQRGDCRFNDFVDFESAFEALEYGTDQYFNSFNHKFKKVNDCIKKYSIFKKTYYKNDIVGFVPIVPNFIQGNPVNMINQEYKEKQNPTATLIFEKAMSASHDSDDMVSFASIIFSLIQILERKGIRCQVYISSVFRNEDEVFAYKIKIKNFMQPLNIYKLQFPVIATDMFRRIGFRLLECCNHLQYRSWKSCYGQTLIGRGYGYDLDNQGAPKPKLQKLLKIKSDDIFIPNYTYFDYSESDNIDRTIKKIINRTNLKKYINLE